jgi:tetratricopeptide (TPR) repeat protein
VDAHRGSTSSWDYLDFELEISGGGPREYSVAIRSPAGEAQGQMRFPFDEWELKDRLQSLEIALLRSGGTRRRMPSPEEHTVQDFGRSLFESLLVGDVRTRYEMSLSEARRQGKGLRLKLRIQPSELAVLPWEFLYDVDRDRYPCLSSNTPLVRYLDLPQPVEPLIVSPPLRVLGMVTSPLGLDPLDVEHEKRLVEEATRGLSEDGLLELTWLDGQTWRHLQRAMRRGPWHVFHFVGHGGFDAATEEGAIALSDDAGHMHLLRATGLAELLDDHYPLRLVFLNSCEGAKGSESDAFSNTAATLVRRGVPAVVAMQYEITDGAAIEFSRDFYEALADSLPVDAAVTEARAAVSMDSMLEWGTPVLYMRSPDGRLFDVSSSPRAEPIPETEDRQEGDPRSRYREGVESAWADGKLQSNDVQQLRHLANDELRLDRNAAADIEREVMGDTIETILERQDEATRREQRDRRLEESYARARRLHGDREWQAVVDLFERIHAEDQNYPDPERLLSSSRDALELERRVPTLYDRGQRHIRAEELHQALECFEDVQQLEPGFRDTEEILSRLRRALAPHPRVEVPDLAGRSISRAHSILANEGLELSVYEEVPSDTIPEGEVIEQSPEPETELEAGSFVSITVSSGRMR